MTARQRVLRYNSSHGKYIVSSSKSATYKIRRANTLLTIDVSGSGWADETVA